MTATTAPLPATETSQARFWELDLFRGIAIIMMVIFHLLWDLWAFQILPDIILYAGFWKYFQRATATAFLILVGISLTVSYRRAKQQGDDATSLWHKFFWRGLRIFGMGMCFTLFGWVTGFGQVHIGILHLIGLSIILTYPLLEYRWLNLTLWGIFFVVGSFINTIYLDHNWLVWFGLHTRFYVALDYFPLIPWLGVVLLGIFLGNTLYQTEKRRFTFPDFRQFPPIRLLRFLGRHSLLIYVIHQPLLLAGLYLLGYI